MFKEWLKEFGIMLVKLLIGIVVIAALVALARWVAQVIIASLFWGDVIIGVIILVEIGVVALFKVFDRH